MKTIKRPSVPPSAEIGIKKSDPKNISPFFSTGVGKTLHFSKTRCIFSKKADMKLSDTEVRQLAGVIADTLENGEDYILFETAQMEYDSFGTPVVRRRVFKIRIEEEKTDK